MMNHVSPHSSLLGAKSQVVTLRTIPRNHKTYALKTFVCVCVCVCVCEQNVTKTNSCVHSNVTGEYPCILVFVLPSMPSYILTCVKFREYTTPGSWSRGPNCWIGWHLSHRRCVFVFVLCLFVESTNKAVHYRSKDVTGIKP